MRSYQRPIWWRVLRQLFQHQKTGGFYVALHAVAWNVRGTKLCELDLAGL